VHQLATLHPYLPTACFFSSHPPPFLLSLLYDTPLSSLYFYPILFLSSICLLGVCISGRGDSTAETSATAARTSPWSRCYPDHKFEHHGVSGIPYFFCRHRGKCYRLTFLGTSPKTGGVSAQTTGLLHTARSTKMVMESEWVLSPPAN
jgi:hypothetical protein